jgi:ABC-type glycerol-3-phosphate transport system substrate-binding protein
MTQTNQFRILATLIPICLMLALTVGCEKQKPKPDPAAAEEVVDTPDPITLLIIGDPDLGQRVSRQWSARRDGKLTIVDQDEQEFVSGGFQIDPAVDIVVYPPWMMGELVSRERLQKVRKELLNSDGFNKVELLRHFRTSIIRHNNDTWAVPLGNPNFAMLCNRSLFKQINSEPPATWEQLDRRLAKIELVVDSAGADGLQAKVDMPLSPDWAVQTFLARVAPAICHRGKISTVFDRRTMSPLIAAAPFVESLDQLKAIASARSQNLQPQDVFELAISGQSAIALTWPARGFPPQSSSSQPTKTEFNSDKSDPAENNSLTINSLPGMETWYDQQSGKWKQRGRDIETRVDLIGFSGLVASVTSTSPNDLTAWEFLEWLPGKSISLLTLVESPRVGPFRASHLGDVSRWTGDRISLDVADEYADVVAANHQRSSILMFPRIPGYRQYLTALDAAVIQAISGEQSSAEALKSAERKWDEITDSLGRENQIRAFRASTGL